MSNLEYEDDHSIPDDEVLWRRLPPHSRFVIRDQNTGCLRVTSAAFDNSKDGSPTSIYIASVAVAENKTAHDLLSTFPQYGMASITAGDARSCEQAVLRDPLPDEPAHGFIAGRKNKLIKSRLAKLAKIIISPDNDAPAGSLQ